MLRILLINALLGLNSYVFAQQQLNIPDTLSGTTFNLNIHKDSLQFFPGKISQTLAFNNKKYLGPTLIFNKGDNISIHVKNEMDDTTTVHWHGLHVPPVWDGGPHTQIMNGQTWSPQFNVMDKASTYWYHPHFHGKTAAQVIKGAAGLIIIRDEEEAALSLPRKYGVDDIPIIVQCIQFDSVNQSMPRGMQDSTLIVNGTINPYFNVPSQVVRMRLLNASGERSFNFGFTNNKSFYVIGNDGGLLKKSVLTTRIKLSPGERAEILLDLTGMNGQSIYLMSYASEIPMGVQGGPTMPMPQGSPPMDSPLNGIDFNILKLNIAGTTANPVMVIPNSLVSFTPYSVNQANVTRVINITPLDSLTMDGPFFFNDSTFDMMRIDYKIPLNNTEIWTITNKSMVAHPFHIHDVQFYILDRDGNAPPEKERGRKDVVLIEPNETVRFITKFEDFTDTIIPYMYHCHILMHEDDGMMGQFLVMPSKPSGVYDAQLNPLGLRIYPNPVFDIMNIEDINFTPDQIKIYNHIGEIILTQKYSNKKDISELSSGIYFLELIDAGNTKRIIKKFIKI